MRQREKIFFNLLIIVIVVLSILPLILVFLMPGFIRTDDGGSMVTRLFAFHETIKTGQFPVRFLERINHGFGYPVINFLYPLPFYFGEIIHLLGVSFTTSIKLVFAISIVLSTFAMFVWARTRYNYLLSFLVALAYAYMPYKVFDVYKRGSLGETVAFIFVPLVFLSIDEFAKKNKNWWLYFGSISICFLILAHNVLAFLFLPIIIIYMLVKIVDSQQKRLHVLQYGFMLINGVLIACFFWLPAITEYNLTYASAIDVSEFERYFLSTNDWLNILGIWPPLVLVLSLITIKNKRVNLLFIIASLIAVFLSFKFSSLFWDFLPFKKFIQFPWRLLALPAVFVPMLLGELLTKERSFFKLGLVFMLLVIMSYVSVPKIDRIFYPEEYFIYDDGTTTVKNEYLPLTVENHFLQSMNDKLVIMQGNGVVTDGNKITAFGPIAARINTIYYPGWQVMANNKQVLIDYKQDGFLDFNLPAGKYVLTYKFKETDMRFIADLITVAFMSITISGLIINFKSEVLNDLS